MKASLSALAVLAVAAVPALAQNPTAQNSTAQNSTPGEGAADPRYVWDLTELYPTDAAWDAERKAISDALPALAAMKGTLGHDAASLAKALRSISDLHKRLDRLETYASLKRDEDTRVAANQDRQQRAELLDTTFSKATSYVEPEVIRIGESKLNQFIAADPALKTFTFRLHDIMRRAPHTLGDEAEGVLAAAGNVTANPQTVYTLLANANVPWPTVTLSDGKPHRLDSQGYTATRDLPNRDDRKKVFDSFFATWGNFRDTFGATLNGTTQAEVFNASTRKYPNAVSYALAADNIPESVYKTLVTEANAGLPALYRYFAIRKRLLKVDELHYYDMYVPLVSSTTRYTPDAAEKLVLEGVRPLGPDYGTQLSKAFSQHWMHMFPQPGKTPGAYMNPGAYDVHPYLLFNFTGNYEGVTTIAHEWGHAMHSLLADKAQPYETANYPIFLAEIASTTNEMLLQDHLIATAKSPQEKLYFLNQALELIRGTFYRQTMFAEFEMKTHEAVEKGEALTGQTLSRIYLDLLKRYHGDVPGNTGTAVKIDDAYGMEWAYIPHFYMHFYVYQYATSLAAAAYFSHGIETDAKMRDRYLAVLKAGGSDYPVDVLKRAGLDMTSAAPYRALVARTNAIVDQMEALTKDR